MSILTDFIQINKIGLYCKYGDFYLDPKLPVSNAVISHAHGDHAVRGNQEVYCTLPTSRFMQYRYKKLAAETFSILEYHQKFAIGPVVISFIPAGHILGSAQVMMEYKNVRYLYTGDYRITPDESCEPFEFVNADVLITETTFAHPDVSHPAVAGEIEKLNHTSANILMGAYALGKSQRMIQLINRHCPLKRILLHHSIVPISNIYEELGVSLGSFQNYDRKAMKQNPENQIYIVPPLAFNSYIRAINVKRVFVTGWKHKQQQNDMQLFISDHVDWQGILTTIERVQPAEVWTLHGDGSQLKTYFGRSLVVRILQ